MSVPQQKQFALWLISVAGRESWFVENDYDPLGFSDWKAGRYALVALDVYVGLQDDGSAHVTADEWQQIVNAADQGGFGPGVDDVLAELAKKQGVVPNDDPVVTNTA